MKKFLLVLAFCVCATFSLSGCATVGCIDSLLADDGEEETQYFKENLDFPKPKKQSGVTFYEEEDGVYWYTLPSNEDKATKIFRGYLNELKEAGFEVKKDETDLDGSILYDVKTGRKSVGSVMLYKYNKNDYLLTIAVFD